MFNVISFCLHCKLFCQLFVDWCSSLSTAMERTSLCISQGQQKSKLETLLRGFAGLSTRNWSKLLGMWMSKGHGLSDHFFCGCQSSAEICGADYIQRCGASETTLIFRPVSMVLVYVESRDGIAKEVSVFQAEKHTQNIITWCANNGI